MSDGPRTPPGVAAHPAAEALIKAQAFSLCDRLHGRRFRTADGWEGVVLSHHVAPHLYLTVEYDSGEVGTVPADGVTLDVGGGEEGRGRPGDPQYRRGQASPGEKPQPAPGAGENPEQ